MLKCFTNTILLADMTGVWEYANLHRPMYNIVTYACPNLSSGRDGDRAIVAVVLCIFRCFAQNITMQNISGNWRSVADARICRCQIHMQCMCYIYQTADNAGRPGYTPLN